MTRPDAEVFAALADPTRRRLLDQLARHGPLTATELASDYPISRQAITNHLSALTTAGLLTGARSGREVRYELVDGSLDDAVHWLTNVGDRWDRRLNALRKQLTANHDTDRRHR